MNRKRVKSITKREFTPIANRQWVPVMLVGDGRPDWMRCIPNDVVQLVLASGTCIDPRMAEIAGKNIFDVVGGMDVYRYDKDDERKGFPINKDHYLIVRNPDTDDALLVLGPRKDHNHWLEKLPELSPNIEIIEKTDDAESSI